MSEGWPHNFQAFPAGTNRNAETFSTNFRNISVIGFVGLAAIGLHKEVVRPVPKNKEPGTNTPADNQKKRWIRSERL